MKEPLNREIWRRVGGRAWDALESQFTAPKPVEERLHQLYTMLRNQFDQIHTEEIGRNRDLEFISEDKVFQHINDYLGDAT